MLRALSMTIVTLAAALISATSGSAQDRMRLAWAGVTPANGPVWVIQEKKLLQKLGVEPEIININTSPTVIQALLASEIDAASTSVTALTSGRLAGADIVMIVGVVPTFVQHIVSAANITAIQQLKGKTAGVNRLGSTSDLGLRLALRRMGIDPENELKIVATGDEPSRFAALSKGIIQFSIMAEPFVREAEKLGFRNLFDIVSLKIPFWWNGILTQESIVKSKRPLLLKLTRAMVEAIHFLKTDKEGAKAMFRKSFGISDPEGLERAYRDYVSVYPETPYPTPEGVKTMLDDLAPRNPKAAAADPKSFVDLSLVKEVEASGFIKQLYKK